MTGWRDILWLRRAVFLGGNVALAAAVAILLIIPIYEALAARNGRIVEQRALLARLQGVIAQGDRIRAMLRETEADGAASEFLRGSNEGVVSADLQTRLKSAAESAGAQLRSIQALPANTRDEIKYVGARMNISGPIQTVHRAVHAVETGRPFLFITAATIKMSPALGQRGAAKEPVIDAQVDIYGAVQGGERDR